MCCHFPRLYFDEEIHTVADLLIPGDGIEDISDEEEMEEEDLDWLYGGFEEQAAVERLQQVEHYDELERILRQDMTSGWHREEELLEVQRQRGWLDAERIDEIEEEMEDEMEEEMEEEDAEWLYGGVEEQMAADRLRQIERYDELEAILRRDINFGWQREEELSALIKERRQLGY